MSYYREERGSRRGRDDYDDDRRYSRGTPERDEQGRFMSEGGSRSRSRNDDEDDRYSRRSMGRDRDFMGRDRDDEGRFSRRSGSEGRGQGGWFGDSEGHSEASRRGWDNPRHRESGWFGDFEGHSEASRRGWDNPNHGESGWYGDFSRVTLRLLAADGTIPAMAKAAGMATRKAIPKRRAADGNTATKATTGAGHAMTTMTVGTRAAAAAVTGTTTAIMSAAAMAAAVMAAGPAIRKAIRRLRVAAGRTGADENPVGKFHRERPGESLAVPLSGR